MENQLISKLVNNILIGCAAQSILTNDKGEVIDCLFTEVNDAFTELTGISSYHHLTDSNFFLSLKKENLHLLDFYHTAAITKERQVVERYFTTFNKWLKIEAFIHENESLITILSDKTPDRQAVEAKRRLVNIFQDAVLELSETYEVLDINAEKPIPIFNSRLTPLNTSLQELLPSDLYILFENKLRTAAATGSKQLLEFSYPAGESHDWFQVQINYNSISGPVRFICGIHKVTKLKNSEREFYYFTEEYEKVFNGTKDSMFIVAVDPENNFTFLRNNTAHQQSTGISEAEIAGKTPEELLGAEAAVPVVNHYLSCTRKKESIEYEEVLDLPAGKITWLTTLTPIILHNRVTHLIGSAHNITAFRDTQKALEESKQKLENVIYATNEGTWEWDLLTGKIEVNEKWAEIIGYTRKELEPLSFNSWTNIVHPEDLTKAVKAVEAVINKKTDYYDEQFRLVHRDGHFIWVHDRGKVTSRSLNGAPLIMSGTFSDITRQMDTQEKLRQSEQLMTLVMNTVPLRIYWKNKNLQFLGCNSAFAVNASLADPEDIINKKDEEICWAPDAPKFGLEDEEIINQEISILNQEEKVTLKNGKINWLRTSKAPLYSHNGTMLGMIGTYEDITNQKQAEDELSYSLSLIRAAMEATGDGMLVVNRKGVVVDWNKKWQQMWNLPLSNLEGLTALSIIDPLLSLLRDAADFASLFHTLNTISEETVIETYYLKDDRIIQIHAQPQKIADQTVGRVWNFRDITSKQKQMDEIWRLSYIDHLTAVYNRRFYEEKLIEFERQGVYPISLIVVDVNGLKLANDAFGHETGDKMLRTVAEMLQDSCKSTDYICRIGGDEFVILLPDCENKMAANIAQTIHQKIKGISFELVVLSVSLGVSSRSTLDASMTELFQQAEDKMYASKLSESILMRSQTIEMIQNQLFKRYPEEKIHAENVRSWCLKIGKKMNLQKQQLQELAESAVKHDIGKITTAVNLSPSQTALTEKEWKDIKKHPETGYQILRASPSLISVAEVVLSHHERWDGNGYPKGLKQNEIPLSARIIAVAEAYDVITGGLPYRSYCSEEKALELIDSESGKQFDPEVVEAFIHVSQKLS